MNISRGRKDRQVDCSSASMAIFGPYSALPGRCSEAANSVATVRSAEVPGFSPRAFNAWSKAMSGAVMASGDWHAVKLASIGAGLFAHLGRRPRPEFPLDQGVGEMREEAEIDARRRPGGLAPALARLAPAMRAPGRRYRRSRGCSSRRCGRALRPRAWLRAASLSGSEATSWRGASPRPPGFAARIAR